MQDSWCVWKKESETFFHSLKIKTINDVIYVLGFMKNLLSVGIIANKGHTIVFNSNKCLIIQNKDHKNGL